LITEKTKNHSVIVIPNMHYTKLKYFKKESNKSEKGN
jgi:hypothetical protein